MRLSKSKNTSTAFILKKVNKSEGQRFFKPTKSKYNSILENPYWKQEFKNILKEKEKVYELPSFKHRTCDSHGYFFPANAEEKKDEVGLPKLQQKSRQNIRKPDKGYQNELKDKFREVKSSIDLTRHYRTLSQKKPKPKREKHFIKGLKDRTVSTKTLTKKHNLIKPKKSLSLLGLGFF